MQQLWECASKVWSSKGERSFYAVVKIVVPFNTQWLLNARKHICLRLWSKSFKCSIIEQLIYITQSAERKRERAGLSCSHRVNQKLIAAIWTNTPATRSPWAYKSISHKFKWVAKMRQLRREEAAMACLYAERTYFCSGAQTPHPLRSERAQYNAIYAGWLEFQAGYIWWYRALWVSATWNCQSTSVGWGDGDGAVSDSCVQSPRSRPSLALQNCGRVLPLSVMLCSPFGTDSCCWLKTRATATFPR
jgi:hypothetical protein